jgi:hypothetical protein
MNWNLARALAFQKAIELRTFNLYQSFYDDLRFNEWDLITTEECQASCGQSTEIVATPETVSVSIGYQGSPWGGGARQGTFRLIQAAIC